MGLEAAKGTFCRWSEPKGLSNKEGETPLHVRTHFLHIHSVNFFFFFDMSAQEGRGGFELVTSRFIRRNPNRLNYLLGTFTRSICFQHILKKLKINPESNNTVRLHLGLGQKHDVFTPFLFMQQFLNFLKTQA
jgi:hypothetical protein